MYITICFLFCVIQQGFAENSFPETAIQSKYSSSDYAKSKNNGQTLNFYAVKETENIINITNSLIGKDCEISPNGSGFLAVLTFQVLASEVETPLTLTNVYFSNCLNTVEKVTHLRHGSIKTGSPWDFNHDLIVNYRSGIIRRSLQRTIYVYAYASKY